MSKENYYVGDTTVAGGCGLTVLYGFGEREGQIQSRNITNWHRHASFGTGFGVACFINTTGCRLMYEDIAARYPIVYQSPVRLNENSGNPFFFVIFDTRSPK